MASHCPQGLLLEDGPGRQVSETSTSLMRLQLEVEEKRRAAVLLQRALVRTLTPRPALPPLALVCADP